MSIGTKSLFFWEMGQSPRADLILTQIVVAITAAVREGFFPTMLSASSRARDKRIIGAEDHKTHLQGQLKMWWTRSLKMTSKGLLTLPMKIPMTVWKPLLGTQTWNLLKAISLPLSVRQPLGRMTPHVVDMAHHKHYTEKLHGLGRSVDWN
jgi:hypothetical protein